MSGRPTTFTVGEQGTFYVTATGEPIPTLSLSAAPTWVDFTSTEGRLAGTPPPGSAGTYDFTAVATDSVATATQSFALTVIGPPSKPAPPTAVAGNKFATISWTADTSGGSSITSYTVTSSPGKKRCSTTGALTCTVSGLTNGKSYTFTLTATNALGTGPASPPSNVVTPTA